MTKKSINKDIIETARELVEFADKSTLKTLVPFIANNVDCKKLYDQLQNKAVQIVKNLLSSKEIEKRIEQHIQEYANKIIEKKVRAYFEDFFSSREPRKEAYNKIEEYIEKNNMIDKVMIKKKNDIDRHIGYWIENELEYMDEDEATASRIEQIVGEKVLEEAKKLIK